MRTFFVSLFIFLASIFALSYPSWSAEVRVKGSLIHTIHEIGDNVYTKEQLATFIKEHGLVVAAEVLTGPKNTIGVTSGIPSILFLDYDSDPIIGYSFLLIEGEFHMIMKTEYNNSSDT